MPVSTLPLYPSLEFDALRSNSLTRSRLAPGPHKEEQRVTSPSWLGQPPSCIDTLAEAVGQSVGWTAEVARLEPLEAIARRQTSRILGWTLYTGYIFAAATTLIPAALLGVCIGIYRSIRDSDVDTAHVERSSTAACDTDWPPRDQLPWQHYHLSDELPGLSHAPSSPVCVTSPRFFAESSQDKKVHVRDFDQVLDKAVQLDLGYDPSFMFIEEEHLITFGSGQQHVFDLEPLFKLCPPSGSTTPLDISHAKVPAQPKDPKDSVVPLWWTLKESGNKKLAYDGGRGCLYEVTSSWSDFAIQGVNIKNSRQFGQCFDAVHLAANKHHFFASGAVGLRFWTMTQPAEAPGTLLATGWRTQLIEASERYVVAVGTNTSSLSFEPPLFAAWEITGPGNFAKKDLPSSKSCTGPATRVLSLTLTRGTLFAHCNDGVFYIDLNATTPSFVRPKR